MNPFKNLLKVALLSIVFILAAVLHVRSYHTVTSWFSKSPVVVTPQKINVKGTAIRVALLLDTSNSMDGLIEQAKSQLWNILNTLATAKKDQATPELYISLYEYGNDGLGQYKNWIRQIAPFTNDMDKISQKLFELRTNGGSEYCGAVIKASLDELDWGTNEADLKLIYIAGNEPFTQGPVNPTLACKQAKDKDVIVNTIFCGNQEEGIRTGWKIPVEIANGSYANIDHNLVTSYIETPYDEKIDGLNNDLNGTYIPYGSKGMSYQENQIRQDANAATYSLQNKVNRAVFKSQSAYSNVEWDLVDAYSQDKVKLDKDVLKSCKKLEGKSLEEAEKEIKLLLQQRQQIQEQIQDLNTKRQAFITAAQKEDVQSASLSNSILAALKKQAIQRGFSFEK